MCIQQLEKARVAYHKSCQREQTALDKEKQANENSEMSPEKKQKITEAREKATEEKEKVRRDINTMHHFTLTQSCMLNKGFIHGAFKFISPDSQHATELNVLHSKVWLACCT